MRTAFSMLPVIFPEIDTCISCFVAILPFPVIERQLLRVHRSRRAQICRWNFDTICHVVPKILALPVSAAILIFGYQLVLRLFGETSFELNVEENVALTARITLRNILTPVNPISHATSG